MGSTSSERGLLGIASGPFIRSRADFLVGVVLYGMKRQFSGKNS